MSRHEVKSVRYNLISGGLPLGCKIKDGKIVPAFSAGKSVSGPRNVKYAAYVHYLNRLYVMDGHSLYSAVEGGNYGEVATADAKLPFIIEYREVKDQVAKAVFDTRAVLFKSGKTILDDVPYRICGGVYKSGRVFAIDGTNSYKLCWSGEGGIDDWTEKCNGAGWLMTDTELGGILNLLVYGEHIAIIKKNGISLLSALGSPEDFKVTATVSTPTVYQNCSVVCEDKIYFYTTDGLYVFDGSTAKKIVTVTANDFHSAVYASAYGSTVFFAGTLDRLFGGVILAYEPRENASYFIDLPATAMASASYPYAYADGRAVRLERGAPFTFISEEIGRFSRRKKTLKSIFIDSAEEVDILVRTERRKKLFKGVNGNLVTGVSGKYFEVYVTGSDAEIKQLTATVEYY